MGHNNFKVGHTGVSARQSAGTLERVGKYDQEAFKKARDYLAASPSDSEADQPTLVFPPPAKSHKKRTTFPPQASCLWRRYPKCHFCSVEPPSPGFNVGAVLLVLVNVDTFV